MSRGEQEFSQLLASDLQLGCVLDDFHDTTGTTKQKDFTINNDNHSIVRSQSSGNLDINKWDGENDSSNNNTYHGGTMTMDDEFDGPEDQKNQAYRLVWDNCFGSEVSE
jgi:hypothetical protein